MNTLRKIKKYTIILGLLGLFSMAILPMAYAEDEIISLNKASLEELLVLCEELDLPESMAQDIIDCREANGAFKIPEDLIKIKGMTQDLIEEINPQLMDGDVVYDPDAEPALAPSKC